MGSSDLVSFQFQGLQDVHKCIYLPSSMDKNQYLPSYLNQNILFMVKLGLYVSKYVISVSGAAECPAVHPRNSSRPDFLDPEAGGMQHLRGSWPRHTQVLDTEVQNRILCVDRFVLLFNQIRISSKNPYLPPDLEKMKEEEAKKKAQDEKEKKHMLDVDQ